MNGQPCIRGMRLTVRRVVEAVAIYPNRDDLFRNYPELEPEDVRQALAFAAASLEDSATESDSATLLRRLGHDCMHVGEIGMSKAADEEILAFSLGSSAVVVKLDAESHAILAVSGAKRPSVIRMRLQGLGAPRSSKWFERSRPVSKLSCSAAP